MKLAEGFIRRPVATIMLNLAMVVFGILGLLKLPVRELPDIDPSVVTVLTVYPGANAEVVETEITERIEEAVSAAESIKLITSESREEVSSITIEFTQGRDVDLAAQDVRDLVARVQGDLPEDAEDPVISKQDSGASPIMWVAFFSDQHTVQELTHIADTQVKDQLQTIPGVSSIILGGEKKRAVRLRLDAAKMAALSITALDVENVLRTQSLELPSGRVSNSEREFTVRTLGELKTTEEFNQLIIREENGAYVRLQDIGLAEMGVEDPRSIARFTGRPAIGLGVVRQSKSNTLSVAKEVKKRMAEMAPSLPEGVQFDFPYDESIYIGNAIKEVWKTLVLAFGLVVLTIFIFLRDIRSTFIPAISIPVSIGATFGVMFVLGITVNIFTLLALVLAIGLVVDDTIVVLENIYRHIENGKKPLDAAITAMHEISFAVIATTLSLVAVFLPLVFIGGITGRLLLEFAISLSAAVVISTVVALSLSPMASSRLLKSTEGRKHGRLFNYFEQKFLNINRRYERAITWALKRRAVVLFLALICLLLSGFFFTQLDQEFIPGEDKGRLFAMVITPQGSTPEYTDRMVHEAESILNDMPEVHSYFTATALPFNGPGQATMGFGFVRFKDGERRSVEDIVSGPMGIGARFFGEIEGAISIPIMPKAVDTGFNQPLQLVLVSSDLEKLDAYIQELTATVQQQGFLENARAAFQLNKPELNITILRDRAAALDISVRDITRTLQIMLGGQDLSEIKIGGKVYEVIAQLERDARMTPDMIDQVYLRNGAGEMIPLGNLVEFSERAGPTQIEHFARQRSATIEATPKGIPLGVAIEKMEAVLDQTLPPGFSYAWKGEAKDLKESSNDIYGFMLLAIIVVYMVLAAQFESLVSPFVVMLALPLAMLGAFGLLYLLSGVNTIGVSFFEWTHYAPDAPDWAHMVDKIVPRIPAMNINIFSQVGLILLIGMVTKNSILLVEFANQLRAQGKSAKEAMLEAGLIRLRPILMTSMATIAGIMPIAIGLGESGASRRPLGVVAVGGMITSTVLTLFVIPVIYTLFADLETKWKARKTDHVATPDPTPEPPPAPAEVSV